MQTKYANCVEIHTAPVNDMENICISEPQIQIEH